MCARLYVFVFSSRRRHTRLQGDWSSDVCSSDLILRHREHCVITRRRGNREITTSYIAGGVRSPATASDTDVARVFAVVVEYECGIPSVVAKVDVSILD